MIIVDQPNCSMSIKRSKYELNCSSGWVHMNGPIEPPPPNPSLTWPFNITSDPNERENVAVKYPDVVKQLMEKIELYNVMYIKQLAPSLDLRSDSALHHGIWTPWLK